MSDRDRCMIYKPAKRITPVKNTRPSTPLCGCGASQLLCECVREMERRKCCDACDHRNLPPDVRL